MSVEQQKQEAEQTPLVENSSGVNVKTPLVDALRSYFQRFENGFCKSEVALFENQG